MRIQRWDPILARLNSNLPLVGVELGVWKGGLSEILLTRLPQLSLYMVDKWVPPAPTDSYASSGAKIADKSADEFRTAYVIAMGRTEFAEQRRIVMVGDTAESAEGFPDRSVDFVFIDADHSYSGVSADIIAWFPKVKHGGWIGGHDYDHPGQGEVKRAVHEFFAVPTDIETDDAMTWFVRV